MWGWIAAAASKIGTAASAAGASGNLPDQIALSNLYNKKNATTAYRRQRALYMLDYNLHKPSNQMALLKEANLNPNLVYGEKNAGSVVSHMPTVQAAHAPSGGGMRLNLASYNDKKLAEEQIKNYKEQNSVLKATIEELKAKTREAESRTKLNELNYEDIKEHGSPGTASGSAQAVGLTKRLIQRGQDIASGVADYVSTLQADAYGSYSRRKGDLLNYQRKFKDSVYRWFSTPARPPIRKSDRYESGVGISPAYRSHAMGGYY